MYCIDDNNQLNTVFILCTQLLSNLVANRCSFSWPPFRDTRNFWDRPPVVLIQANDNLGLVLLCVYVFSILWICISIMVYYAAPNWHKDSSFNSIKNGLPYIRTDVVLLNVNLNNFIIEHTTETKICLLVPLDHRNIFQSHWANLTSPDLA
jgi:hypothetical protein